jgi:hypothetical protein
MKIGTPILDLSGRGPYTQWQQAFDPFFIPGSVYPRLYAYWKSLYLYGLDDALIDDLVGRARELPSEQCLIAIWQLGGALARVPETATAFGRRSAPFLLSYDSCWTDPNQNDHVIAWTREQIAAAEHYSPGGSYLNFPGVGEDNESLVRKAYGHADVGAAQGDLAVVADKPAREADQDRREGHQPGPLRDLPNGRGRAATDVRENSLAHCPAAGGAPRRHEGLRQITTGDGGRGAP